MTQHHRLVVTGDDAVPTQVSKGHYRPRLDMTSTLEEAAQIISQQVIHLAKEVENSRVSVLCDDTDVFALHVFYLQGKNIHDNAITDS